MLRGWVTAFTLPPPSGRSRRACRLGMSVSEVLATGSLLDLCRVNVEPFANAPNKSRAPEACVANSPASSSAPGGRTPRNAVPHGIASSPQKAAALQKAAPQLVATTPATQHALAKVAAVGGCHEIGSRIFTRTNGCLAANLVGRGES